MKNLKKGLKIDEQVMESYKILAYTDNILDSIYMIENGHVYNDEKDQFKDFFKRVKNACINFKNRLNSKKNTKANLLLDLVLSEHKESDKFETYRDTVSKAVDFVIKTHPDDSKKLNRIIDCSIEEDMIFMNKKNLGKLLVDCKLYPGTATKFMKEKGLL